MKYNGKNRKLKAEETRQKIYNSAERLFSEDDYSNVSVDSIVKDAGVAKGSFYLHYASKDELIAELINNHVTIADTDYKAFIDSFQNGTPAETILLSLVEVIADVLDKKIGYSKMKAIYKAQLVKDVDTSAVMGYNRALYKMLEDILNKGLCNGEFKTELSSEILARHFMIALRGITYEWCIRYYDFDLKSQILQHFNLLISGIKS